MSITKVKIVLESIGINVADAPRKVEYLPMAYISHSEKRREQTVKLIGAAVSRKKKYYEDMLIEGDTFFAILHNGEYKVFNEDGDLKGTVPFKEVGVAINADGSNEFAFVCLKDRTATFISDKGKIVSQRKLSDEEYEPFKVNEQWRKTFYKKIMKETEEHIIESVTAPTITEDFAPKKNSTIVNKRELIRENPDECGVLYSKNGNQLIKCNNKELSEYTIPDGVTTIRSYAFSDCNNLKRIYVPSSVEKMPIYAFSMCNSLERIDVADDNVYFCSKDGVVYSKNMKELILVPNNSPITSYNIPDGVIIIGSYAFSSCLRLREVTIPSSVGFIGSYAFSYCPILIKVSMSNKSAHGEINEFNFTTSIEMYAFYKCTNLKEVIFPNNINKIKTAAFESCTSLSKIFIPKNVTNIDIYAFTYCDNLERIDVDDENKHYCSVDGVLYSKDKKKLVLCPCGLPLTSFNIPEGTKKIGNHAFDDCHNLTKVLIPNSVTEIGETFLFSKGNNLKHVILLNPKPPLLKSLWNMDSVDCVLYVPKGAKEAYSNAEYWKNFCDIVEIEI